MRVRLNAHQERRSPGSAWELPPRQDRSRQPQEADTVTSYHRVQCAKAVLSKASAPMFFHAVSQQAQRGRTTWIGGTSWIAQ